MTFAMRWSPTVDATLASAVALDDLPFAPERVLAIGAHPDDVEFAAGGTLARLRGLGALVTLVVCTDGRCGGRGLVDAAEVRRREQQQAAGVLGVDDVVHLTHPDGGLSPGEPLLGQLVTEIRRARPDLVMGHDPRTFWQTFGGRVHLGHSDHRAAGQATLDAIYPRAANPNFYLDQLDAELTPWKPRELWLFDAEERDLIVDVSETFELKLEALRAHRSQEAVGGGIVEAARASGERLASAEHPAEAFLRLRIRGPE
jgi:LmbE family N-acetylglucosaminyl deacetylase